VETHEFQRRGTSKYVVASRLGRWRVTFEAAAIGAFDTLAEASRFACDVARLEAQAGVATLVVVNADIREMHCFTPPAAAIAPPARAQLRLVEDAG
jgi:hypothetical protein